MSDTRRCNFCHRGDDEVDRLLGAASGAHICDRCVAACARILADPATPFPGYDEDDDDQLLARLRPALELVDAAARGVQALVDALRARGASWARIGDGLGMSRQAAWERFGSQGTAPGSGRPIGRADT